VFKISEKKLVIIGAGQTGRGFIAPIAERSDYDYCFIDKNDSLVKLLSTNSSYKVSYYNDELTSTIINDKSYYLNNSKEAINAISEANVVVTAVGKNNIVDLIPMLKKGIRTRTDSNRLSIILCENGIDVKQPLIEANIKAYISEGIIFSTSLIPQDNSLNILTEAYPNIPYDANVRGIDIEIDEFIPEMRFSELIQRKIYTYNFLSAVISYLGYYKNYNILSEAANDKDIGLVITKVIKPLNKAISKEYSVNVQEQIEFSKIAIKKFKNKDIIDTISRNTREVERKLGPEERLITPLRLCLKHNQSAKYILLVIASAIYYGIQEESVTKGILSNISKIDDLEYIKEQIINSYNLFNKEIKLTKIIELI